MQINIAESRLAREIINSESFRLKYNALFDECQATCFQDYAFIHAWYNTYTECDPVLVYAEEGDLLIGVLFLYHKSKTLYAAGGNLAEYQTWVCSDDNFHSFVNGALSVLMNSGKYDKLYLKYLTEDRFKDLSSSILSRCHFRKWKTPILDISGTYLGDAVKKKSNRSKINRLEKLPQSKFSVVNSSDPDLLNLLKKALLLAALRHDAYHKTVNYLIDANKLQFFKTLLENSHLVHFSLWSSDLRLVTAHYGFLSKKLGTLHVGLLCHDPAYSRFSPGKVLIFKVIKDVVDKGISYLDMTPGNDEYKERYASSHFIAYECRIYFHVLQLYIDKIRSFFVYFVKHILKFVGIDRDRVDYCVDKVKRINLISLFSSVKSRIKAAYDKYLGCVEYRIYTMTPAVAKSIGKKSINVKENDVESLLKFREEELYQRRCVFLRRVINRLESGCSVYSMASDTNLQHYGWVSFGCDKMFVSEVQAEIPFKEGRTVLWDFYTAPSSRRCGLFHENLLNVLYEVGHKGGDNLICIGVLVDNVASRKTIENLGFEHSDTIVKRGVFRNAIRCAT